MLLIVKDIIMIQFSIPKERLVIELASELLTFVVFINHILSFSNSSGSFYILWSQFNAFNMVHSKELLM